MMRVQAYLSGLLPEGELSEDNEGPFVGGVAPACGLQRPTSQVGWGTSPVEVPTCRQDCGAQDNGSHLLHPVPTFPLGTATLLVFCGTSL